MPHSSIEDILTKLQERLPDRPFLALGQTVFWDEPVKAIWRRLLDQMWPSAQLIAGIHDTDYFAKSTAHVSDKDQFIALEHDDGATRGLWSAAGEMSALFGSEDFPSRSVYESLGVPFNQLAGRNPHDRRVFFARHTAAYGWRGIVQTGGANQISHDVLLSEFGEPLLELLRWGFNASISNLADDCKPNGEAVGAAICGWVSSYLASCQDGSTLTELYQYLLPHFYQLLLDIEPSNFSVSSTSTLLRFNRSTALLPRFAFVEIFLNTATSALAKASYSSAVAGGGMYGLDHFGEGALPFDVVVPGKGRGTLHILADRLEIDFAPSPFTLATSNQITSLLALADHLEDAFGNSVVLVGKAVSLISMLAAEFTLIFHETASGYTDRTASLNESIRTAGIDLPRLSPIVRLQYRTWDSLSMVTQANFNPPKHIAEAFCHGSPILSASALATTWHTAVAEQKDILSQLRAVRGTRNLLRFLARQGDTEHWEWQLLEFDNANKAIMMSFQEMLPMRQELQALRDQLFSLKNARQDLEAQSSADFNNRLKPLLQQNNSDLATRIEAIVADRLRRFYQPISEVAQQQRELSKAIKQAKVSKKQWERSPITADFNATMAEIAREADMAKLDVARTAYLTVHGLPHMNCRPSAWWLPMVDPTGNWFDEMTETVEARLEWV